MAGGVTAVPPLCAAAKAATQPVSRQRSLASKTSSVLCRRHLPLWPSCRRSQHGLCRPSGGTPVPAPPNPLGRFLSLWISQWLFLERTPKCAARLRQMSPKRPGRPPSPRQGVGRDTAGPDAPSWARTQPVAHGRLSLDPRLPAPGHTASRAARHVTGVLGPRPDAPPRPRRVGVGAPRRVGGGSGSFVFGLLPVERGLPSAAGRTFLSALRSPRTVSSDTCRGSPRGSRHGPGLPHLHGGFSGSDSSPWGPGRLVLRQRWVRFGFRRWQTGGGKECSRGPSGSHAAWPALSGGPCADAITSRVFGVKY